MNPLTNMKNVLKLSDNELKRESKTSWHDMYKDSAWIFVGGLPYDLTEGDIISVFSQYGEIVNINLIRDKITGKQKGYCFICYEDQRSTILSVDNLNGIKILGRTLRVDHVADYKVPKENDKTDEETKKLYLEGCAPKPQIPTENIKKEIVKPTGTHEGDIRLPPRLPIDRIKAESQNIKKEEAIKNEQNIKKEEDIKKEQNIKVKKVKKEKKKKNKKEKKSKKETKSKKSKRKRRNTSSSSDSTDTEDSNKSSSSNLMNIKHHREARNRSSERNRNRYRDQDRSRSRDRSKSNEGSRREDKHRKYRSR